tara:strand:- start:751 stop:1005 length:255 start_codon:yes stop_codon:yes gene_type:complete
MATLLQTTITGGDGTGSSTDNYLGLTNHNAEPGAPTGKLYANSSASTNANTTNGLYWEENAIATEHFADKKASAKGVAFSIVFG